MSKILRRGIRTGFIILSLLIFGAVFTGWDIFLQNYNNRSRVTPILAVFVLLMGIILWETNGRRTDREARICGNRTRTDRIIKWSSVIIFVIQIFLFWNIFFKTGWDVAVIENGARVLLKNDGSSEWLSEYFSVYPNNILLTWFYCFTLWIGDIFGMSDTENVQMIFIICNSAISCITAYLTYYCTKKLCGIRLAVLGYIFCVISICMSPWAGIPYSDPLTVFIPVTILTLFIKIESHKDDQTTAKGREQGKNWLWGVVFFLGMIGYHIKPQTVIVLIAIVIVSVTDSRRKSIKQLFIVLVFCLLGVLAGQGVHKLAYHEFDKRIPLNEEKAFSYYHWNMMGLNDTTNGRYNEEDVDFSKSFVTKEEQIAGQKKIIGQRLKGFGVVGYLKFLKDKAAICYSDGTFSWSTGAGDFYVTVYDEKIPGLSMLLRNIFYHHGAAYPLLSMMQQIIWISLLFLCVWGGMKRNISNTRAVLFLIFIGAALFELIFEIFPRHLYCNVPCFIVLAMCGLENIHIMITTRLKGKEAGKRSALVISAAVIMVLLACGAMWVYKVWGNQIADRLSMRNVEYPLLPGQDGHWELIDQIGTDDVVISGRTKSSDYPYGYNVGSIEDEEVGKAVLITPSTSVSVFGEIQQNAALEVSLEIHPWVAEASDGAIVNVEVVCGEEKKIFSYEVLNEERTEIIDLKEYEGEKVRIVVSVSNKEGCNENCDWMILKAFSITVENR